MFEKEQSKRTVPETRRIKKEMNYSRKEVSMIGNLTRDMMRG